MQNQDLLLDIIVSACLGALVGLIRQWSDQLRGTEANTELGGLRTYSLWSILGCLGAASVAWVGPSLFVCLVVLVGIQQLVSIIRTPSAPHVGGTTFASILLTLLCGALVAWHHRQAAVLVAASTMIILGIKQTIHAWTRTLTNDDIRGMVQFMAITGVILPLVPNKAYGPFNAFNPYSTWLMVVLISGLGFAGYIAMRFLRGSAGITLTGLAGGLASSTATTLAFSRSSKEFPEQSADFSLAVILACTVMLARILVVVAVLNPALALAAMPGFAALAVPGMGYIAWHMIVRRKEGEQASVSTPKLHNPLSLGMAIKFACIYAVVAFLVKAVIGLKLTGSMLPLSFLSGLTDMDAIALLLAENMKDGTVPATMATQGLIIAGVGNTVLKGGLALSIGSPTLKRHCGVVLGLTALFGLGALFLI